MKKELEGAPLVDSRDEEHGISELNKRLLEAGVIKKVGNPKGWADFFKKYPPLEISGMSVTGAVRELRESR